MINDPVANQPLLDYTTLPPQIKLILDPDKRRLVSNIYQNYDSFINYKDQLGNNVLHYAYSSNNLDVVILLNAIYNFPNLRNNAGKSPIALYDVDEETRKRKIRELLSISSSQKNIYKKFINTLLLLESDDVKKTLLEKFIRESTILNREFERHEFEAYFSELLENDSDDKFKEYLLNILPSQELFVIYQKISGSIIATPKEFSKEAFLKEFSLEVLKKIFNQDNNTIKQIVLQLSLELDDKDHLDFICEYIIANPSSSKNLVQDEDYENVQTIAESFINSSLSYEQKSSLVKTILTDENFDESTKNKFFSALLKNQEFLKSFIDEDSGNELLMYWNFDILDDDNLSLAFKQISSIQEEKRNEHTKLLL